LDPSLIALLIVLVLISAQAFYFGFYREAQPAAWLQQASFIVTITLLIPSLIYALYSQAGSTRRLEESGIPLHPDYAYSIGLNNGTGKNATWVFALRKDAEDVLSFYEPARMYPAWELKEANSLYVRYAASNRNVMIAHSKHYGKQSVIITMNEK
jgi:hypothetical protein